MLDFNLLLPDVMIIADEVDAQLTQTMDAFATPGLNIGSGVACAASVSSRHRSPPG